MEEVVQAVSTPECPKGTHGRMAVFEVFENDKELQHIILKNPTEPEISKYVRAKGMTTMKEDAIVKALKKVIPFEEINGLA
jgi:type II secretory ATPase GspE/PulE/Tfp pilus assembly ATPase PilB-like protein